MKYAVLVGDGMADDPVPQLGGKTPLDASRTSHMDALAQGAWRMGMVRTIPRGYEPGSDVGNMTILGYDPGKYYTGRAPIEAVSMGIELEPEDVAIRCNLVTLEERERRTVMADYSAGHLSTEQARPIVEHLRPALEGDGMELHPGVSYRHLLVWRGGRPHMEGAVLTPPHNIPGDPIEGHLPRGSGSERLVALMDRSRELLSASPAATQSKANAIWLWGAGTRPDLPSIRDRFDITGSVISAVPLVSGLGACAGLRVLRVPGATGYLDTNYRGKAAAALEALAEGDDLVYLHVEAPDEASHEGSVEKKVRAIEDFDARIVGPIVEGLARLGEHAVLLLPDHPTSLESLVHMGDPVPFVIHRGGRENREQSKPAFSERMARGTGTVVESGHRLMGMLFRAGSLP